MAEEEKVQAEKERRAMHRQQRLDRDKNEVEVIENFKKLVGIVDVVGCDKDMLKCSACNKSMGIKKWARLATKDNVTCPGCRAVAEVGTIAKTQVVAKEKSRFKVVGAKVDKTKASVEERPDGTRLIKETINVEVKSMTKKN